jgi:hypothetical protein
VVFQSFIANEISGLMIVVAGVDCEGIAGSLDLIIELYKKLLIICKISSCIFSQMRQGE